MAYLLDKRKEEARRRLLLLAGIEDPGTVAGLERIGVASGWRCLEVGGGAGTIAAWLAERVAPGGTVVATDIEPTFLEPLASASMEVRRHDVAADALEEEAFDLVHVRNVLVHVPEREAVLGKLAAALRPGGWLLVEELDRVTDGPDPTAPERMQALYRKVVGEIYAFVREAGLDPTFGGKLFGLVRGLGLEEVHAEGRSHVFRGDPDRDVSAHVPAFIELEDAIVARGAVSAAEFAEFVALTRNPDFAWREGLTVACRGRKARR